MFFPSCCKKSSFNSIALYLHAVFLTFCIIQWSFLPHYTSRDGRWWYKSAFCTSTIISLTSFKLMVLLLSWAISNADSTELLWLLHVTEDFLKRVWMWRKLNQLFIFIDSRVGQIWWILLLLNFNIVIGPGSMTSNALGFMSYLKVQIGASPSCLNKSACIKKMRLQEDLKLCTYQLWRLKPKCKLVLWQALSAIYS